MRRQGVGFTAGPLARPPDYAAPPGLLLREGAQRIGVLAGAAGANAVRLVTHADVGDADVNRCLAAFGEVAEGFLRITDRVADVINAGCVVISFALSYLVGWFYWQTWRRGHGR